MSNYDTAKRKAFQRAKQMTNDQFWSWMTSLHGAAYDLAKKHDREAAEILMTPRHREALFAKADQIRVEWDGLDYVSIDLAEFTLHDIMQEVQKEMIRAAGIHGAEFTDLAQAKEAIDEEVEEVWEAIGRPDKQHAVVETIQLIGVLVKLIRGMDRLVKPS